MSELKFVCECGKSYPASKIKTDILNTYCDECDAKNKTKRSMKRKEINLKNEK